MNHVITVVYYFVFSVLLVGCSNGLTQASAPPAASAGTVTLYFDDGTPQCTFQAASAVHAFPEAPLSDSGLCKYLKGGGHIRLNDLPSATQLWLVNGRPKIGQLPVNPRLCHLSESDAFSWWQLTTIKNPTTTDPSINGGRVRIADLKTLNIGDVVVPGLRLTDHQVYASSTEPDQVNCMIIEISPLSKVEVPSNFAEPAKITLEGANGENHCTLDFKTQNYVFKGNAYCNNDEAIKLELEHAPSASNILLFDDYTCDRNDDGNYFWVYLRTIKEDVSTVNLIDLDDIAATPIGNVVAPGIRLMDRYQKPGESMKKRTSCVQIQVDAPPLPPVKKP
ncbi:hypothetical protein [Pseudomonas caricapapayae]|nr:hypothetical protein [Pseudomonas caricapapayae]